jgi:hypothetical protein
VEAKAQVYEKMKRLLITGVKAIPEYERAASEENRRQQFISTLPKQEDKEIPWQPDGKGGYQVPRGYKDEKPPMQLSPEELERHFSTNTKTLSDGTVIQFEQTPNGGKWTKLYEPAATSDKKDDSFNKNKARTTYINDETEKRITRIAKSWFASNPKAEPEEVERYKREVRGAVEEAVKLEVASWDAAGTQSPPQTPQAPQGQQTQPITPQAPQPVPPKAKSREEVMALKAQGVTEFLGPDGQLHRIP